MARKITARCREPPEAVDGRSHCYHPGMDTAYDIAIDASGNAYITGSTNSSDFSTVNGFDTTANGASDAFLTVLNSTATTNK